MVAVKDLGIGRLRRELGELGGKQVVVGVIGDKAKARHPNAGTTVAQVSAWFNFGRRATPLGGPQPPRPFLERAFKGGNSRKQKDALRRGIADLIDGRVSSSDAALESIAEKSKDVVLRSFSTMNGWAPSLAAWTVAAKGHSTIGYDTYVMADAITAEVRPK